MFLASFMAFCLYLFELLNMCPDKSVNKVTLFLICTLSKLKVCIKLFFILLTWLAKSPPLMLYLPADTVLWKEAVVLVIGDLSIQMTKALSGINN